MTTTQTTFNFTHVGASFAGTPLWEVTTPGGRRLGFVSKMKGKRGDTWAAVIPGRSGSTGGFRNREKAAEFLLERTS